MISLQIKLFIHRKIVQIRKPDFISSRGQEGSRVRRALEA